LLGGRKATSEKRVFVPLNFALGPPEENVPLVSVILNLVFDKRWNKQALLKRR
jgi:hypothetical protein